MMTLRDLINKLLGRETSSANTARERLQLVLAHDRVDMSALTTDLLDKMRKEILDVVAKYVEIDFEEVAVSLETEDRMTAVSYTHLRAHETRHDLVCRLLLEKKK